MTALGAGHVRSTSRRLDCDMSEYRTITKWVTVEVECNPKQIAELVLLLVENQFHFEIAKYEVDEVLVEEYR
jgi:hypothetical protein